MMPSDRTQTLTLCIWLIVVTHFVTPQLGVAAEVAKSVKSEDPVPQQPPPGKLPHALLSLKSESGAHSNYAFLVDKTARTISVWENAKDAIKLIGAWPTDIGQKPGDKLVQGDHRTPEGIYFMQTTMDGESLNFQDYGKRIFTLDYPNYFDQLEKKTGNGIWFHAIPETKSLLRGSRGCVVVRNEVIEELSKYIELKLTPMVIVDRVEYLEEKDWFALKNQLHTWIESWRQTWSGKDLDAYMSLYSERFQSNGMNKSQWRRYKRNLASQREMIQVDLQDIQIFNQGPKIVFRFLQDYQSDLKKDFGRKIVYVQRNGSRFEIVGESWEPLSQAARSRHLSGNSSRVESRN